MERNDIMDLHIFDKKVMIDCPQYVVMTQTKGCGSYNECCTADLGLPEGVWFKNFAEAEKYYQEMCRNISVLHASFFIELNTHDKSVQNFRPTPDPVYS